MAPISRPSIIKLLYATAGIRASVSEDIPWYLSGAIPAANCIAAYQAKGAASLAASYVNLANPGTYNAFPGVAPDWTTENGWMGDIVTNYRYLRTGILPGENWSLICKFTHSISGLGFYYCGSSTSGRRRLQLGNQGASGMLYGNGDYVMVTPAIQSGVLAVAGQQGYRNGSPDGGAISASSGGTPIEIYILSVNNDGVNQDGTDAYIQALSIYNITVSAQQVASLTTAMQAL